MKYLIQLAYKGTNYHGWQRQIKVPSVQEILEQALEKMLGKKVNCIGCGRTDAGVHASQFFCHIIVYESFKFDVAFRLNKMLPNDISIYNLIPVNRKMHAQHDAISRTYTYKIHTHKNAFLSDLSSFYSLENMDFTKMGKAIELLLFYDNYKSMCKQPELYKNTICHVTASKLQIEEERKNLIFKITANRFLRGMVRLLIGNILEVGYGRKSLKEFENQLKKREMPKYFKMAYPQGLYLSEIIYPDWVFEHK